MLSFLKVTFLSILLTASLSASDLLLKATNGIISDNDFGVKQLTSVEMEQVIGGYAFDYAPNFNNDGGYSSVRSYAFVVVDNKENRDAGAVADEFNLGSTELLVLKARFLNRKWETYVQVYDIETGQKVRELIDYRTQYIQRDFAEQHLN